MEGRRGRGNNVIIISKNKKILLKTLFLEYFGKLEPTRIQKAEKTGKKTFKSSKEEESGLEKLSWNQQKELRGNICLVVKF